MHTYFISIEEAVWLLPVIALVLTLPYAIYNYIRYGSISFLRTLILFTFLFYMECAYFLVILPLPDPATVASNTGPFIELTPFYFVKDFLVNSGFKLHDLGTWLPALKTSYAYEPAFNLALTLPFGIYLGYYFRAKLLKVSIFSFLLSLFFELTQLTGLYFIYSKPYRVFSVDDIILNTLGGIVGYLIYRVALRYLLPDREKIDRKSVERSVRVTYTRRFVAFIVDWLIVVVVAYQLARLTGVNGALLIEILLFLYPAVMTMATKGRTVGKLLVRLRVEAIKTDRPFVLMVVLRYFMRSLFFGIYQVAGIFTWQYDSESNYLVPFIAMAVMGVATLLFVIDYIFSFRRGRRLWYERITQTANVSSFRT